MKKLLIAIGLTICNSLMPAVAAKAVTTPTAKLTGNETFSYSFNTFHIHNLGTQPITLNSISVLFSIGVAAAQPYKLTYKKSIKKGKTGKIAGAKITFKYPAGTQINYSGISEININNNQTIKISNPGDYDIYLINQGNSWKETTEPKTSIPKAKNISAKIAPTPEASVVLAKNTAPAAKTSTLKSATLVVKKTTKTLLPQSKTAKAINTATMPKSAIIKPEVTQQ
jgi:hypothetical protein